MTTQRDAPPSPAPDPWTHTRAARVFGCVGAIAVLSALQLVRQQGAHPWNTVWAEDGTIFFQGGNRLSSLWHTYAGYLEFVPRVIGLGANLIPLSQVSRYLTAVSAVITSLCALVVYVLSGALVPSRALRAVLAVAVPALPAALYENLNSATNAIWVLLFVNFWALLVVPRTRGRVVLCATVCFLSAVSSVLALLYFPLAALLALKRRDVPSRIVLATFGAGLIIQTLFVVTSSDHSPHATTHAADLLPLYSVRVLGSGLLGERLLDNAWDGLGYGIGVVGGVVIVTIVGLLLARNAGTHLCLGCLTIAYSVGMYICAVGLRGSDAFALAAHTYVPTGARFVTLSLWLLLSGIAILLSGARASPTTKNVCIAVLVLHFVVVASLSFRGVNGRSGGPPWSDSSTAAQVACEGKSPETIVSLPISPPGWSIELSCDRVGDS